MKVGDVDDSAPEHWEGDLGQPEAVHLIWTVLRLVTREPRRRHGTSSRPSGSSSGAFSVVSTFDGAALGGDRVHFGYRDSIAQPRFDIDGAHTGIPDHQPIAPLGAVLLGHRLSFAGAQLAGARTAGARFQRELQRVSRPRAGRRRLRAVPSRHRGRRHRLLSVELVAAKLMGRWRNGVPLVLSPDTPDAAIPERPAQQLRLRRIPRLRRLRRRASARSGPTSAEPTRVRRASCSAAPTTPAASCGAGMPYGPPYDPAHPNDGVRRGLLGNFICGSLIAQFEAVMYDWINLGLQDPRITATNDPLIGANTAAHEPVHDPAADARRSAHRALRLPALHQDRRRPYCFIPSITALRFLASARLPLNARASGVDVGLEPLRLHPPRRRRRGSSASWRSSRS